MNKVTVIGAGTMGNGIAHVFAQHGYQVSLVDIKSEFLEKAIAIISKNMDRQVAKGAKSQEEKKSSLGRIATFTNIEEGVSDYVRNYLMMNKYYH